MFIDVYVVGLNWAMAVFIILGLLGWWLKVGKYLGMRSYFFKKKYSAEYSHSVLNIKKERRKNKERENTLANVASAFKH